MKGMRIKRELIWRIGFDNYYRIQARLGFPSVKKRFKRVAGYEPNLEAPKTFNEKLTHRKLHCRDEIWISVSDKVAVREYLEQNGLPDGLKLIPMVGIFSSINEMRRAKLPSAFIAKAAWASGQNFIVRDFATQKDELFARVSNWFESYSLYGIEKLIWPAQHIPARVIVEELLLDAQGSSPADYKFFIFHGTCRFFQVDIARYNGHRRALFNRDLEKLPVRYRVPIADGPILPDQIGEMISIAEDLAHSFDFIRVDLYLASGEIYFGELTQTPVNGCGLFDPVSFDHEVGDYWNYAGVSR